MRFIYDIESFSSSDKGLIRDNNEDVVQMLEKHHFYILADGMGGHNAGEVAAAEACEYMCRLIQSLPLESFTTKDVPDLGQKLVSLMEKTNLWVHHLSKQKSDLSGMGTTLCSLLFFRDFMLSSHVGDSRIYRFREGVLTMITKDHLTFKGAMGRNKKYALTQAIGTNMNVNPSLLTSKTLSNDLFLMCSDGLSDLVSDKEIEKTLQTNQQLNTMSNFLITLAKDRGGHDNITLLLTRLNEKNKTTMK